MAIPSGNGGSMLLQAAPAAPPHTADNVEVGIGKWTLNKNKRLQEKTRSTNTAGTRYGAVVGDPSWTVELPFDTIATVESVGLDHGTSVPLILFKVGASAVYYMLTNGTVDTVEPVCDNNGDVVRYRVTGKGGDVSGPNTLANLGFI